MLLLNAVIPLAAGFVFIRKLVAAVIESWASDTLLQSVCGQTMTVSQSLGLCAFLQSAGLSLSLE